MSGGDTSPGRRRIFNRYLVVLLALVGGAVLVTSGVGLYLTYLDTQTRLTHEQRQRIGIQERAALIPTVRFFAASSRDIESGVVGTGDDPAESHPTVAERRAFITAALPAEQNLTELGYVDRSGRERVRVAADGRPPGRDESASYARAAIATARERGAAFGRVYLARLANGRVQPRVPLAVADPAGRGGVLLAQLDLSFFNDFLHQLRNPSPRLVYYVVDPEGRLVARSDLPDTTAIDDVSSLPQVRTALASHGRPQGHGDEAISGRDLAGHPLMSSYAFYNPPGWYVIANQAGEVARSALGPALIRTGISLAVFLALAVLASYLLARRMVRPIQAIQGGAARIGAGALDERLDVRTGDELESLADEFNLMATRLGESYATLEQRVDDRTRDLVEALDELERVSGEKTRFLANMSHELRTPLNAIINFADVLQDGADGPLNGRQSAYVGDIHAAGRHLLVLITDILDLARIEAGRMELDTEVIDVQACLDEGLSVVRERARAGGLTLTRRVEPGAERIEADGRKLRQVLFNLLANAVRFTPPGGAIEVRARRRGEEVEIAVADTGVGIDPADHERIFGEFEQAGTAADRSEGTGLGLALARRLVALHGGRILLRSAPGAGSTFTVVLPVRPPPREEAAAAETPAAGES